MAQEADYWACHSRLPGFDFVRSAILFFSWPQQTLFAVVEGLRPEGLPPSLPPSAASS